MAEIKNFGIAGIGSDVQLGKAGPRLKTNGGAIELRDASGEGLVPVRGANAVALQDMVTLGQLQEGLADLAEATSDGFKIKLGDVATDGDGSWNPGAVPFTDETKISDAVDSLNEILGKLIPSAPPAFPNGVSLAITNQVGSSVRLADGATDNIASGLAAGTTVQRIVAAGVNSNTFSTMGAGESGTVSALMNGSILGSKVLTGSGDNGTYSGLVISGQADFPVETPGFWKSINVGLTGAAAPIGINKVQIRHSDAGNTNEVTFVRDQATAVPAITGPSLVEAEAGTLAYSSSIPHYGNGASLTAKFSISNLANQTYYGGSDAISISGQNAIISTDNYAYGETVGIATPIAVDTISATETADLTIAIDGNVHHSGKIQATAKNVTGASTATDLTSTVVLVKRGSAGSRIDEMSVPVTGLGSAPNGNAAVRVGTAAGAKPALASVAAWTQASALQTYDAAVVGGVLKHDQTNYSTGFLPAGPNLSVGRSGAQYVTFAFNRSALSQFKINVTGTYAGCWIALPGISDAQPNGDGWWDCFKPYDGAGIPGEAGDTLAGCAAGTVMSGANGAFTMTFGTASSTNSTGNTVYVRFQLNAGQSITALSFTN